jgi:hypothetical protein
MEVALGVAFQLDGELSCGVRTVIINTCIILMFCNTDFFFLSFGGEGFGSIVMGETALDCCVGGQRRLYPDR